MNKTDLTAKCLFWILIVLKYSAKQAMMKSREGFTEEECKQWNLNTGIRLAMGTGDMGGTRLAEGLCLQS